MGMVPLLVGWYLSSDHTERRMFEQTEEVWEMVFYWPDWEMVFLLARLRDGGQDQIQLGDGGRDQIQSGDGCRDQCFNLIQPA